MSELTVTNNEVAEKKKLPVVAITGLLCAVGSVLAAFTIPALPIQIIIVAIGIIFSIDSIKLVNRYPEKFHGKLLAKISIAIMVITTIAVSLYNLS